MTNEKRGREEVVNDIIEIEFEMFPGVKSSEPSLCQERPEAFRTMRDMTHSVLSTGTLESYLEDLQKAKADGRNLLTDKYARMQNLIPPLKTNPAIGDIVKIEAPWMRELSEKYPRTFKTRDAGSQIYLSCELETYSDETLRSYRNDVSKAENEGKNLTEERYIKLFQQMGYGFIAEAEDKVGA